MYYVINTTRGYVEHETRDRREAEAFAENATDIHSPGNFRIADGAAERRAILAECAR